MEIDRTWIGHLRHVDATIYYLLQTFAPRRLLLLRVLFLLPLCCCGTDGRLGVLESLG